MKKYMVILVATCLLGVVLVALAGMYKFNYLASQPGYDVDGNRIDTFERVSDYKNTTYTINGEPVTLVDGVAEREAAPGSATTVSTQYFGNELWADLNDDGREDIVFLLTQNTGGSGTFFYAVAALNTENGWHGSNAYLLGDRIAPQTTELITNPNHQHVVVINYADRAPNEPMSTSPSQGKSVYFKLDLETLQFGEVDVDFEGEADPTIMTLDMKTWTWVRTQYNNDTELTPKTSDAFTITFQEDGVVAVSTDCNAMQGTYELEGNRITFGPMAATKMYCEDSQEAEFAAMLRNAQSYFFTGRGELIFDLMFDTGSSIFR